jgi:hypothetical protein
VRDAVHSGAPLYDADLVTRRAVVLYYLKRNVTPIAVREPRDKTFADFIERLIPATIDQMRAEPGCFVLTYSSVKDRIPEELYSEPVPGETNWMGHRGLNPVLLRARATSERKSTGGPASDAAGAPAAGK